MGFKPLPGPLMYYFYVLSPITIIKLCIILAETVKWTQHSKQRSDMLFLKNSLKKTDAFYCCLDSIFLHFFHVIDQMDPISAGYNSTWIPSYHRNNWFPNPFLSEILLKGKWLC